MKFSPVWITVLGASLLATDSFAGPSAQWWLTTPDRSALLSAQVAPLPFVPATQTSMAAISVDPQQHYQEIDGFGFALTGGSADHLLKLPAAQRRQLLEELFSPAGNGIGVSYLRVSIGASDLNQRVFSYDDLPAGQTDVNLERFSLDEDIGNIVPVLREILAINPRIPILGSPWSAPAWMKTNQNVRGGKLQPACYPVYARYFVRYVQAMAREGITIDAVTVQNEPFNDLNTPSMQFFAKEEAAFIRDHLGPAFQAGGLQTKIILYDHNCDAPEYPVAILTDPAARKFVAGSGFHLYAGSASAMTVVHDRFPEQGIYFTEMMVVNDGGFAISRPTARILIGVTRNWSRNVILWNLAADAKFQPHTDNGGCSMCQGAITIDGDKIERNLAYYVIGHAAKFVPPGSVRIGSTDNAALPNVAFLTPANRVVLIVANVGDTPRKFDVACAGQVMQPELPAGAVATFVW